MKILAVGIALFHAGGRMDERTDVTRIIAFTTALQTCVKEAYVRQHRYTRPQLHWSQNRHNTTVWTECRQGSRYQPHYCLGISAAALKPIRLECYLPATADCLAPTKWVFFLADSLARYLLQCALDSSVFAMDKTYLIELLEICGLFGTKEIKIKITGISSRNFEMK